MPDICLGFEVHQPLRLNRSFTREMARGAKPEDLFELYFNNTWNKEIFQRVAGKCYLPANAVVLENIERHGGRFKVAYSLSGVFLEQCERWAPELLDSFKGLVDTGCVELLDQTYYHSLASLFSPEREEFVEQVRLHTEAIASLFGYKPKVFENTEFVYNNSIAKAVEGMGYKGIFTEGAERVLGWRSPNHLYRAKGCGVRVLLRNYRLADDIAFRFSSRWWSDWPLTADKYASWLKASQGQCINLFMDYETFGEHHWKETGILEFLRWLPGEVLRYPELSFRTPSELVERHEPVGELDVDDYATVSWADIERDTGAWLSNDMQRTCYHALKGLERPVKRARDKRLLRLWRLLQISDHLYYMFIAGGAPGIVHGYFSQQPPFEAFRAFTNILEDFQAKVAGRLEEPYRTAAYLLRVLPPERGMHYHEGERYVGVSAHSLEELSCTIRLAPPASIAFHTANGDLERWVRFTIGDGALADRIRGLKGGPEELHRLVAGRVRELRGAL